MASLATAFVSVEGDFSKVRQSVPKEASAAGKQYADGFYRDASGRLRTASGKFATDAESRAAGFGKAGKKSGESFGSMFSKAIAVLGVGAVIKSSIGLEAAFGRTMSTLAAATGAPAAQLRKLNDLALTLGADTSFSANEAADAMLELAKAGLSTKTIMGGGVAGTLTLAAAGGTSLATAATIASNALNTFNLRGKDMDSVAAALAGGANASTASVESLGMALQQVGPGAINAGLSLQETVAALAAFDSAGIKGSDAGTSLKTMLARLEPQTDKAARAMERLGLDFTNAQGNFIPLAKVADQLQDKMKGLSQAERTRAMAAIFGSDATRAATVLMNEGEGGIRKYIKATMDQGAAQEMADARMSGTAGALERMKGSLETAALSFGQALAPMVVIAADKVAEFAGYLVSDVVPGLVNMGQWVVQNSEWLLPLAAAIGAGALAIKVITTATKLWAAAQALLNLVMAANPVGIVIVLLVALAAGLVVAYKKSETFRNIVNAAWAAVKKGATVALGVVMAVVRAVVTAWQKVRGATIAAWQAIRDFVASRINAAKAVVDVAVGAVKSLVSNAWSAVRDTTAALWGRVVDAIRTKIANAVEAVRGIKSKVTAALSGIGGWLYDSGVALVAGLISGIAQKIEDLRGIMSVLAGVIKGALPGSPVKWGPLTSWNNGGAGKRLVQMLADGLADTRPVDDAMRHLGGRVTLNPGAASASRSPSWGRSGTSPAVAGAVVPPIHIGIINAHDDQAVIRAGMNEWRKAAIMAGLS